MLFIQSKFKYFPKVYWLWNHRRWCLELDSTADWNAELGLVNYLLERDARNFHGWHYRRYIVSNIEKSSSESLTKSEFDYTTKKINENFSNFSAWHNRNKLIPEYLQDHTPEERRKFLESEINYVIQAIFTDPEDQSGWLYHQWLVTSSAEIVPDITKDEIFQTISSQINSIADLYEEEPDNYNCMFFLMKYLHYAKSKTGKLPETNVSSMELLEKLKKSDSMRINMYQYYSKLTLS